MRQAREAHNYDAVGAGFKWNPPRRRSRAPGVPACREGRARTQDASVRCPPPQAQKHLQPIQPADERAQLILAHAGE
jgi:hypothetical protein